jgi:hypothetical protein
MTFEFQNSAEAEIAALEDMDYNEAGYFKEFITGIENGDEGLAWSQASDDPRQELNLLDGRFDGDVNVVYQEEYQTTVSDINANREKFEATQKNLNVHVKHADVLPVDVEVKNKIDYRYDNIAKSKNKRSRSDVTEDVAMLQAAATITLQEMYATRLPMTDDELKKHRLDSLMVRVNNGTDAENKTERALLAPEDKQLVVQERKRMRSEYWRGKKDIEKQSLMERVAFLENELLASQNLVGQLHQLNVQKDLLNQSRD